MVAFVVSFCLVCFWNTSTWTWAVSSLAWILLLVTAVFYMVVLQESQWSCTEYKDRAVEAIKNQWGVVALKLSFKGI